MEGKRSRRWSFKIGDRRAPCANFHSSAWGVFRSAIAERHVRISIRVLGVFLFSSDTPSGLPIPREMELRRKMTWRPGVPNEKVPLSLHEGNSTSVAEPHFSQADPTRSIAIVAKTPAIPIALAM